MVILDLILLIFLGLFLIYGFYLGLVRMLLQLLATILSIIIAIKFHGQLYDFFPLIGFGSEGLGKVISFILVLVIASYLLGLVFKIIARILKILTSLPLISFVNRALGGLLGLLQGLFILGAIVFVMSQNAFSNKVMESLISGSELAPILIKSVAWISPFIPEAIETVDSIINQID